MGARAIACLNARDRNVLGLRRDLLTAAAYGVDEFLCVYGDRPAVGARVEQLSVRDMIREVRTFDAGASSGSRLRAVSVRCRHGSRKPTRASPRSVSTSTRSFRWRDELTFGGRVYAGVIVLASPGMARKLSGDLRDVVVPGRDVRPARPRTPSRCGDRVRLRRRGQGFGAFDGVHLIPVGRYRETAAVLEARRPRLSAPIALRRRRGSAPCRCRGRERSTVPGRASVATPSIDDRGAVDDHALHADRVGEQAADVPPGRSSTSFTSPVSTVSGIEHERGRRGCPRATSPRSRRPNSSAGHLRHQLHAAFHRHELAAAEAVAEELRGVRRAAHAVEVRAGVGAADHHERVVPRLGAHLPRLRVAVGRERPQHGAQVVVDHDVERACRTCRLARSSARSATTRPFRPVVGRGERVADHVAAPRREPREHAGLGGARPLVHPLAHRRDRAASRCARAPAGSSRRTSPAS